VVVATHPDEDLAGDVVLNGAVGVCGVLEGELVQRQSMLLANGQRAFAEGAVDA
jgi:hypothetical protein